MVVILSEVAVILSGAKDLLGGEGGEMLRFAQHDVALVSMTSGTMILPVPYLGRKRLRFLLKPPAPQHRYNPYGLAETAVASGRTNEYRSTGSTRGAVGGQRTGGRAAGFHGPAAPPFIEGHGPL